MPGEQIIGINIQGGAGVATPPTGIGRGAGDIEAQTPKINANTAAVEKNVVAKKKLLGITGNLSKADRMYSRSLLAVNMSLLGVMFSSMMMMRSMEGLLGIQIQQNQALFAAVNGFYALIGVTQLMLSLDQMFVALQWEKAHAMIAAGGMYAGVIAAIVIGALVMFAATAKKHKSAQAGAWVPATPGGQMVLVAEGGEGEIISPIPKMKEAMMMALAESGGATTNYIYAIDSESMIDAITRMNIDAVNKGVA